MWLVNAAVVIPQYVSVGLNNYKMEFRRSAMIAALTNRSLCLASMTNGKTGDVRRQTVSIAQVYDVQTLENFVHLTKCPRTATKVSCKKTDVLEQPKTGDLAVSNCLFPVAEATTEMLLWRYLRKPTSTLERSKAAITELFGDQPFASVHWRFEEGKCARRFNKTVLGLCFRSHSEPPFLVSEAKLAATICNATRGLPIFLATDGRARGRGRRVDDVKARINATCGVRVAELDNFKKSPLLVSEVEQAISAASTLHVGSSQSSWDWEVFYDKARNDLRAFQLVFHLENHFVHEPHLQRNHDLVTAGLTKESFSLLDVLLK